MGGSRLRSKASRRRNVRSAPALPQYGGYCAWAVAQGQLAPGNPTVFKVVDNKLYLNVNREIAARWEKDIPGFIRAGDANWPRLKK